MTRQPPREKLRQPPRRLTGLRLAAILICTLAAGLWLAASVYLESSRFQTHLLGLINANIPGTLTWKSLDFSLLHGKVTGEGIRLKTPAGKVVADIASLDVNLDWTGLPAGQLVFSSLTFETPRLDIDLDREGQTDILAALVPPTTPDASPDPQPAPGLPLNLVIRKAEIREGRLDLTGPDWTLTLPDLTLGLSGLDLARQVLDLTLAVKKSRIQSGSQVLDLADLDLAARLDRDRITALTLGARASGLDLALEGGVEALFDRPVLDLTARLTADTARVVPLLESALGQSLGIQAAGPARVTLSLKGSLDNPLGDLALDLGPGRIQGQAFGESRLQARLENRRITLAPSRVDPGWGPVDLQGEIDLTRMFPGGFMAEALGPERIGYTLSARQEVLDLARLAPGLSGRLSPALTLTGQGVVPGSITADLTADIRGWDIQAPGLVRPADLALRAGARVGGQDLDLEIHALEGPGISGLGRATLRLPWTDPLSAALTGTLDLSIPDLALPAGIAGLDLKGSTTLSLRAGGTLASPRVHADLSAQSLESQGLGADSLTAALDLDSAGLNIQEALVTLKEGRIRASGQVSADRRIRLNLDLDNLDLAHLDLAHLAPGQELQGLVSGSASLAGTLDQPQVIAGITGEALAVNQLLLGRIETQLALAGSTLAVSRAELTRGRSRLSLSGQVNLENQVLDLRLSAPDLDLEDLTELPDPLSGHLALDLSAKGPWTAPELDGRIQARQVRTTSQPDLFGELAADVRVRGPLDKPDQLRADADIALLSLSRGGSSLVRMEHAGLVLEAGELKFGPVPVHLLDRGRMTLTGLLDLAGNLTASARGTLPLAMAASFAEGVRNAEGDLQVSLSARGPVSAPDLQGEVTFSGLTLGLDDLEQPLEQLAGTIHFTPEAVQIRQVTGRLGEGSFQAAGSAALAAPQRFDLTLEARQVSLDVPDTLSLVLNGRLTLAGTPAKSDLTGRIDLLEGRYYRDVDLNLVDLATRKTRKVSPAPRDPGPEFLKQMALNIQVSRRTPLLVENNLAHLTISPDLTIRGTAQSPTLAGRAQVDEGTIFFQKAKFDVTGGTVDFINPYKIVPEINITGETVIRSWTITVKVSGTPDDLQLSFSSTPSEPDADILSLIAFGRTTREMGTAQGSGQMATASAAAGLVADPLSEKLKEATGLDEVNITMEDKDGTTGVKVSLGADLSRQLSVAYGVDIRDGETVQQVTTYYKLLEHLLMSGFQDTGGRFGGGLKYRLEFR